MVGPEEAGAGFLVSASGLIVTCAHVLAGCAPGALVSIEPHVARRPLSATVDLLQDPPDVAVLRLTAPVTTPFMWSWLPGSRCSGTGLASRAARRATYSSSIPRSVRSPVAATDATSGTSSGSRVRNRVSTSPVPISTGCGIMETRSTRCCRRPTATQPTSRHSSPATLAYPQLKVLLCASAFKAARPVRAGETARQKPVVLTDLLTRPSETGR